MELVKNKLGTEILMFVLAVFSVLMDIVEDMQPIYISIFAIMYIISLIISFGLLLYKYLLRGDNKLYDGLFILNIIFKMFLVFFDLRFCFFILKDKEILLLSIFSILMVILGLLCKKNSNNKNANKVRTRGDNQIYYFSIAGIICGRFVFGFITDKYANVFTLAVFDIVLLIIAFDFGVYLYTVINQN